MGGNLEKSVAEKKGLDLSKLESKDIVCVIKDLIQAKKEYESTKEQEITKRYAIECNMTKYLKNLEAKKELFYFSFTEEYKMRKESIDKMFTLVENALADGKNDVVIKALDSIEGIVKESPLKGLAQIARSFENDDEELEI